MKKIARLWFVPLLFGTIGCTTITPDLAVVVDCSNYEIIEKEYGDFTGDRLVIENIRLIKSRISLKVEKSDTKKIVFRGPSNLVDQTQGHIFKKYEGSTLRFWGNLGEKYKTDKLEIEVYGYTFTDFVLSQTEAEIGEGCMELKDCTFSLSRASKVVVEKSTVQNLKVTATGASEARFLNFKASEVESYVSGASNVSYEAITIANNNILTLSGASACSIYGTCDYSEYLISGASSLQGRYMAANEVKIVISGASKAAINAVNKLSIDASGASSVEFGTTPAEIYKNISGGSKIIIG